MLDVSGTALWVLYLFVLLCQLRQPPPTLGADSISSSRTKAAKAKAAASADSQPTGVCCKLCLRHKGSVKWAREEGKERTDCCNFVAYYFVGPKADIQAQKQRLLEDGKDDAKQAEFLKYKFNPYLELRQSGRAAKRMTCESVSSVGFMALANKSVPRTSWGTASRYNRTGAFPWWFTHGHHLA